MKNFVPNNVLAFHRVVFEGYRVDSPLQSLEDWNFLLSVFDRAAPCHYDGGGAVVHKDYLNTGMRRGTQTDANDSPVVVDLPYIYRRWCSRRKRSVASARRCCRPPGSRCR